MSPVTLAIVGLQAKPASFGTIVSAFLGACKKPIVLAPIIGVIFVFTGVQMPEPLEQSFLLAGEVSLNQEMIAHLQPCHPSASAISAMTLSFVRIALPRSPVRQPLQSARCLVPAFDGLGLG
jgi:hypothetical protein